MKKHPFSRLGAFLLFFNINHAFRDMRILKNDFISTLKKTIPTV
jgi:hypothetical protein